MKRAGKSRILSLRIDEPLLDAVRERAIADGRSVSGEIVHFVRDRMGRPPERAKKRRPLSNCLAGRGYADLDEREFQLAREEISKLIRKHVRRKAKRF